MFPHGDAQVVSSAPGLRGGADFSWSTGDAMIVRGFLGCDLQPFNPLIAALPRLLHLRAGADPAWIANFTQQAVAEACARRPGGEAMLARRSEMSEMSEMSNMSKMMFVDAVRRHADPLPPNSDGWLAGLHDRFVGRALALLHERPAQRWTIDELGRCVGLARSARHEHLAELIGAPPMQYLAQWRTQAAARRPRETHSTIASIAVEVGQDPEAAFARAFKRRVRKPPAA